MIRNACFNRQQVLFEATQPFVLVDYHADPPSPTFKDGILPLIPECGGARYAPITPVSAAISVDDENPGYPASSGFPAAPGYFKAEISAIYDAVFYRYRQVWTFHGTGDIDLMYGFGGFLLPVDRSRAHFHSPYWRLDLDLDNHTVNYFEQFGHPPIPPGLSGADSWDPVLNAGAIVGNTSVHTKFRVRTDTPNVNGELHSWEIEPRDQGNTTEFATSTVVPVIRTAGQDGADIGIPSLNAPACTDRRLDTVYANNPLGLGGDDISTGADLVVWVSANGHHEPRHLGEEGPVRIPGFHYVGIHLSPRNFLNGTP